MRTSELLRSKKIGNIEENFFRIYDWKEEIKRENMKTADDVITSGKKLCSYMRFMNIFFIK